MATDNIPLLMAGLLSQTAAIVHFACIFWGANGFRRLGAGEPLISLAAAGHWYPRAVAFAMGAMLTLWAVYALSGAGVVGPLPYRRTVLALITGAYLIRALAFPLLKPAFPGNSMVFWLVSSGICLVIGLTHLIGLAHGWAQL
ncbi:MAG: hypothetical protein DWQ11_08065 [Proteobacteria bacterium]|nr:MAG: hypothetical protein DWQ11_08065 [Pseudomonadota bacterium]